MMISSASIEASRSLFPTSATSIRCSGMNVRKGGNWLMEQEVTTQRAKLTGHIAALCNIPESWAAG